jgi:hypothetical protein
MSSTSVTRSWSFPHLIRQDGHLIDLATHQNAPCAPDADHRPTQSASTSYQAALNTEMHFTPWTGQSKTNECTPARLRVPSDASQQHSLNDSIIGDSLWQSHFLHGDTAHSTPYTTCTPAPKATHSVTYGNQLPTPASLATVRDFSPAGLPIPGRASTNGVCTASEVAQYGLSWAAPAQVLHYSSHLQMPSGAQRQIAHEHFIPFTQPSLCDPDTTPGPSTRSGHDPPTQNRYDDTPATLHNGWQTSKETTTPRHHDMAQLRSSPYHPSLMLLENPMLRSQGHHQFDNSQYLTSAHDQIGVDAEPVNGIAAYASHQPSGVPEISSVRTDPPGFDYEFHDRNLRTIFTAVKDGALNDIDEKLLTMSRYFCADMKPRGRFSRLQMRFECPIDMRY